MELLCPAPTTGRKHLASKGGERTQAALDTSGYSFGYVESWAVGKTD